MRAAGVSASDLVVVYDGKDSTAAARAWWTLRYFGHERVRVLDGGYRAWVDAGRPVTTEATRVTPGDFTATPGRPPAARRRRRGGATGERRAARRARRRALPRRGRAHRPVAGHIPGAVSAPTGDNVGGDGRFLSPERLRERFAGLGAHGETPVGAYCGSGSPPPTRCWPSPWRASRRPCTPARGRTGSPTPAARSRPAERQGRRRRPAKPRSLRWYQPSSVSPSRRHSRTSGRGGTPGSRPAPGRGPSARCPGS